MWHLLVSHPALAARPGTWEAIGARPCRRHRDREGRPGRLPRSRRCDQRAGGRRGLGTARVAVPRPRTSRCARARSRRCGCCAASACRWSWSPTSRAPPRAPRPSTTWRASTRRSCGGSARAASRRRRPLLLPPPRRHRPRARRRLRLPQAAARADPAGGRGARHGRCGLGSSWLVGDSDVDVEAGRAAGLRTILVEDPASAHRRARRTRRPHGRRCARSRRIVAAAVPAPVPGEEAA